MSPLFLLIPILLPLAGGLAMLVRPIKNVTRRRIWCEAVTCAASACVWAAAGEGTDQVGKAVILDDGIYHYAVAVLVPSEQAGEQEESIRQLLDSVQLE